MIHSFRDYHLNCEEVLARYLATVLEEWPRGYQSVVHEVIGLLKTTEWIEKFFCETLEKVLTQRADCYIRVFSIIHCR